MGHAVFFSDSSEGKDSMTAKTVCWLLAWLLCGVFLWRAVTLGSPATRPSPRSAAVQSLLVNTDQGAQAAVNAVEQERAEIITLLRERIREPETPGNRARIAAAMKIAAVIRAGELADALIEKIGFRADGPLLPFGVPRPEDYPAVQALIAVGGPSMGPLIRHLRQRQDGMELLLINWSLSGIEQPGCLKRRLQALLDAEPADRDTTAKGNLREVISMIHVPPGLK